MCEKIAPQFNFDSKLIYAVCLQEGGKNKDGTFAPDIARLEQNFYRKYVEDELELATTSEVLLAASYGVMQMMGDSLRQADYFKWYFSNMDTRMQEILGHPHSQFCIPNALDAYCVNLEWMIIWGCKWMDIKRKLAKGNERLMLTYWNGSSAYPDEVYEKLKGIS